MLDGMTLVSTSLGTASALITISDKIDSWVSEWKYSRSPKSVHFELQEQFGEVQCRSLERLNEFIENEEEPDRTKDKETLWEIRRDTALHDYIDDYRYRNYDPRFLSLQEVGLILELSDTLQKRYKNNTRAKILEKMYTGFFNEEMAHHELLGRWYDHATNERIIQKCDEIREIAITCNQDVTRILNGTIKLNENVEKVNTNVVKSEKSLRLIRNMLDEGLLYITVALIGTGIAFILAMIMGIELDDTYIIAIPGCFFISDILVCSFRKRNIINVLSDITIKNLPHYSFGKFWIQFSFELVIFTTLQTIIALTEVFAVSRIFFLDGERGGVFFWILAFFLGSLVSQLVRERQKENQIKDIKRKMYELDHEITIS